VFALVQRRLGQHSKQRCLARLRQADDASFHESALTDGGTSNQMGS
jgi:hypothetical protein